MSISTVLSQDIIGLPLFFRPFDIHSVTTIVPVLSLDKEGGLCEGLAAHPGKKKLTTETIQQKH